MKLRIGAHDFDVVYLDEIDSGNTYGQYRSSHHRIELLKEYQTPKRRGEIKLHEMGHAIVDMYNMQFKDDEEEKFVRTYSLALAQTIRDNPEWWAGILKDLK